MSQSPDSVNDAAGVAEYGNSWKETIKMVRHGTSWSGRERNCVYLNLGNTSSTASTSGQNPTRFANVSSVSGVDFPDDARAMAVTDWDQDGDLDIWLRNRTAPRVRLLRNDTNTSTAKNYISVKLRGTQCNPDAIGAIATFIGTDMPPITQSVRAGDAFVSQSSRWLHFGSSQSGSINVHWPGGKMETFNGLSAGNRYELQQGTGTATSKQPATNERLLTPTTLTALPATDAARIVLPSRLPFPILENASDEQTGGQNSPQGLLITTGIPTLVTFWTNTCPNCRSEISEFVQETEHLAARGLAIVGINLDNLQPSDDVDKTFGSLAENLRQQTTQKSISTISDLQQSLFDKYPPFVVPLSFLLDSKGNIGVIYRGAVGLDTVFDDMAILTRSNTDLRNLASPFSGTWFTKPASTSEFIEYVAKRLYPRDQGLGLRYFEMALDTENAGPRKQRLSSQLVTTYRKLGRSAGTRGDYDAADSYLRQALAISNAREKPAVHHDLGVLYASTRDYAKAEVELLEALRLQPNFPSARKNLELVRQKRTR